VRSGGPDARVYNRLVAPRPMAKRLAAILLLAAVSAPAAERVRTILVFPFENQSSRTDLAWLPEGFADLVSRRLSSPARYVFSRDQRDAASEQAGLAHGLPLTLASQYQVAEILGVDWIVVGSFSVRGDLFSARAQLLDLGSLKLSPSIEAEGKLSDLDDISTRLAWRMLSTHEPGFTTGGEDEFRRHFPPLHLDAFESYVRGVLSTDPDGAIGLFTEADRRDPSDHHAAFALGKLDFRRKDYAAAGPWLAKVVPADDDYAEALFMAGVGEFFLGHIPTSEHLFQSLEEMIPLGEVSNNLGVMETREGQYAEALARFDRAHQGDPSDPDFSFNRSVCLWHLNRFEEAAKALEESLDAEPNDAEAHAALAVVLGKLGNTAGRDQELKWLSGHEGPLTASADPAAAGEDFQPLTRLKKNFDGRAFRLLSMALENEREEKLAALPPDEQAAAHLARGKELLSQGRPAEAEQELQQALDHDPNSEACHLAMAEALETEGKHGQAATQAEAALRVKDSAAAHLVLANIFLNQNRIDPAREQVRSALTLEPANPTAQKLMDRIQNLASGPGSSP
jgi:Tfp pilus assembly protein PilF/TolB-like protein